MKHQTAQGILGRIGSPVTGPYLPLENACGTIQVATSIHDYSDFDYRIQDENDKLGVKSTVMTKILLAVVAHPDDAEFLCAGTLALLHKVGWRVHLATMTPGDCGSKVLGKSEISAIRKNEAAESARILDGQYECLDFEDLFITYDEQSIRRVVGLVRKIRPRLVFTMSPQCYMVDHEITSRLMQSACFGGGLVNIDTPGYAPIDYVPHLYYADAIEGKDKFGQKISCTTYVDISGVMEVKTAMLECHGSQREWLRQHHGVDEYILAMKRQAEDRGGEIGVKYAEGFRQHLGHAFPQDNLLLRELANYTHIV